MISFQWMVCLLASNLQQIISETIWDFLFLEGSVAIFRAILAILNILEPELLQMNEFNDLYVALDSLPREKIKDPEIFIKHMHKYSGLKQKHIERLRHKHRPVIMREQQNVWIDTSRSGCPAPSDSSLFKRVKLLNKFFLLNRGMRKSKSDAVCDLDESKLLLTGKIKCSPHWPICLYDFTVRSRITNFFVFKVNKPVKVIVDYFGEESDQTFNGGMHDQNYLFVPLANKEITIYDTPREQKRKRQESAHFYDSQEHDNKTIADIDSYNQLLMSRETHPCVYKGFETHFHNLFDNESDILFQNWTIH